MQFNVRYIDHEWQMVQLCQMNCHCARISTEVHSSSHNSWTICTMHIEWFSTYALRQWQKFLLIRSFYDDHLEQIHKNKWPETSSIDNYIKITIRYDFELSSMREKQTEYELLITKFTIVWDFRMHRNSPKRKQKNSHSK